MIPNPGLTNQLAREHHRQMLAAASQRRLRREQGRPPRRTPDTARIIRRLATVIAATSVWVRSPSRASAAAGEQARLSRNPS
jgi:hypothetical protein